MKLGLKKDEVKLVPYDVNWKSAFLIVKKELIDCVKLQGGQIEHIGSTSIEGIQAKPIIDILVGVKNLNLLDKAFFSNLRKAGFYRLQVQRPNEIVCAKFTDETFDTKTHFLHIVELNKEKWHQMLFFRDYLNANEEVKKQYQALKNDFFSTNLNGINAYTEFKEQFVQSIFSKMEE
ncbi:GrpB family protein [Solibacillus sp. MA9]|uniref:GrpB family protein n=1 Tax=Solibacillus palustris TaxID=2908203 RepID=A0ABS9UAR5_9BACL|nr:GrpB family protein [Solibacillus sp. MA9]MCH7321437.1 GrpB family protein [Solibacillus sp. MA9]